ncbi:hypothetical protein ABH966_000743, partial [Lysinibacillus sp. RC46]
KRSDSNKCFICAKAKRQQQGFYLCESEATATSPQSERKSTTHIMMMSHFIPCGVS